MTSIPISRPTEAAAPAAPTPDAAVPAAAAPVDVARSRVAWWSSTRVWAGISIVAMWIAVLFVGVYGPDFESGSMTDHTTIPSVVFVAICAMVGTITVAHAALRGSNDGTR
jgi:hypothetical protein